MPLSTHRLNDGMVEWPGIMCCHDKKVAITVPCCFIVYCQVVAHTSERLSVDDTHMPWNRARFDTNAEIPIGLTAGDGKAELCCLWGICCWRSTPPPRSSGTGTEEWVTVIQSACNLQ